MDIGRTVTADDMTGFFIDFMQNDQLGRIATLHQVLADDEPGTRPAACLDLASLHSTAVDLSKTGVLVSQKVQSSATLIHLGRPTPHSSGSTIQTRFHGA